MIDSGQDWVGLVFSSLPFELGVPSGWGWLPLLPPAACWECPGEGAAHRRVCVQHSLHCSPPSHVFLNVTSPSSRPLQRGRQCFQQTAWMRNPLRTFNLCLQAGVTWVKTWAPLFQKQRIPPPAPRSAGNFLTLAIPRDNMGMTGQAGWYQSCSSHCLSREALNGCCLRDHVLRHVAVPCAACSAQLLLEQQACVRGCVLLPLPKPQPGGKARLCGLQQQGGCSVQASLTNCFPDQRKMQNIFWQILKIACHMITGEKVLNEQALLMLEARTLSLCQEI